MKKNLNILIALIFALCSGLSAQQPVSDGTYLSLSREYTQNPDGSWDYSYSHKLKIHTYFAFHNLFGEDFIVYNPEFQSVKVLKSETTMADGKVVASPANAFNELLPGFAANAPAFNHLRELVVTHTALECGAVIDFAYTLHTAKGYSPMTANDALPMTVPVDELTYTVQVPAGTDFRYDQFNLPEKPRVIKSGKTVTYSWTVRNLQAATREDFRPKAQQQKPRITFTAGVKDLLAPFADVLNASRILTGEDPGMLRAADDVKNSAKSELEKVLKIQEIVVNDINYFPVPLAHAGFKAQVPGQVWKANGGTEAGKAGLLACMLTRAGVKAEPVAVVADYLSERQSLNLLMVERFLVKVAMSDGNTVYLSPLALHNQDERYALQGRKIIALTPKGKAEIISEPATSGNSLKVAGTISIEPDLKTNGKCELELTGKLNPSLKLGIDKGYAKKLPAGIANPDEITSAATLATNGETSSFSFDFAKSQMLKEEAGYVFFKIPALAPGFESWNMNELTSSRTEQLEVPYPLHETYGLSLRIPEGYAVVTEGQKLSLVNSCGSVAIDIRQEGREITIRRELKIEKGYILPSEYPSFKELVNSWQNRKYREIILKKEEK